jgi:tRNA pseudouridine38-40 synthase
MNRYFLEVAYNGTRYAGSQVQANAITVQWEIEKALGVFLRKRVLLTGSSRTDAGVHALQNYFHFDFEETISFQSIYNINSILPGDITVRNIIPVPESAHCRFDAVAREYEYFIYQAKNPFLDDRGYYFPYTLDMAAMEAAAKLVKGYTDFTAFAKRNTQVKTHECVISDSEWMLRGECRVYHVKGNRFLRGMVRGLTGTMLQVGRGKITVEEFVGIIEGKDSSRADFSVPGHGLFLNRVIYPEGYFR